MHIAENSHKNSINFSWKNYEKNLGNFFKRIIKMNIILNREIFLKRIVEIFFLYMILEGVLRKWIFPNFSFQIYFLKDIFLILIYLIALKYNLIFKLKFSKFFVFIIILISLYGLTGYDLDNNGIVSYVLGLRSYWLFLPLFLIVVHVYDKKDLNKIFKI